MRVECVTPGGRSIAKRIASAMAQGVIAAGDKATITGLASGAADVAICYGWKYRNRYQRGRFVYVDLGYWDRDNYYRCVVNGWGPESYLRQGLPSTRFERLGVEVKPWKTGEEIIIAGGTMKAARDQSVAYQHWEETMAGKLKPLGFPLRYRPKPKEDDAPSIRHAYTDRRPLAESFEAAHVWVTHRSNTAVEAIAAGVPTYCEAGAGAAFSIPFGRISDPPLLEGREQFLSDVAWLQWTLDEMRSGECWRHLRKLV